MFALSKKQHLWAPNISLEDLRSQIGGKSMLLHNLLGYKRERMSNLRRLDVTKISPS